MWHIDDSMEYLEIKPCSPDEVISILRRCSHSPEKKAPAMRRVAELSYMTYIESIPEEEKKRIGEIADRASFGFNRDKPADKPKIVLDCDIRGAGPYHEEEYIGYDVEENEYIFVIYVISPMAYVGGREILCVSKHEIRTEEELRLLKTTIVDRWNRSKEDIDK